MKNIKKYLLLMVLFASFSSSAFAEVYSEFLMSKRTDSGNQFSLGLGYKEKFCCFDVYYPTFWGVGANIEYGKTNIDTKANVSQRNRYIGLNPYVKVGMNIDYFTLSADLGYNFQDYSDFDGKGYNFALGLDYDITCCLSIGFKHKYYKITMDDADDTKMKYYTNGLNIYYKF